MKKWIYLIALYIWAAGSLTAQVTFQTRVSKKELSTNDRLRVSFDISTQGERIDQRSFTPPSFEGFQRIMGPSTSQEYSFINGRSSAKLSYSYVLQPLKTGTLTIGPARVVVDGQEYTTKPVSVKVVKGAVSRSSSAPQANPNAPKSNNITVQEKVQGAFLVAEISKKNPYINEAVGLTYRLYIPKNYGVANYTETAQPQYNGFWVQDIDKNISGPYQGEVNGKSYMYYVLRKKLLFPQQSGKLTIKPLTLQIDLQVPVYRNFFGMRVPDFEMKRVKLTSGKKILQVKPLPKEGQPVDFSGAVGDFDFQTNITNNQVKSGEPVNVTVQVSGLGNLKLFDLPKLKAPDGLEVYEPKHIEHVKATFKGNKGTVQDEYIIVPDNAGKYIIPGMRFVYFDPAAQQYVTKTSKDIILFVSGGQYQENAQNMTGNKNGSTAGADFRFIKEETNLVKKESGSFYGSKLYRWLIGIPFVLALLLFAYQKYQSNKVYDADFEKRKKNKNKAAKFLKEARKAMGDKEQFYAHLEKALHNFLKAQLHIDTTEMTRANIEKKLQEKNVSQDQIDSLLGLLNRCDMARYAPASGATMKEDYAEAERLMNSFK